MKAQQKTEALSNPLCSTQESELSFPEYQLRDTLARERPFPHTLIRPIFTDGFYLEMLKAFPSDDSFTPLNEFHLDRGAVFLTPDRSHGTDDLDQLDDYQRAFWSQFSETFGSDRFREALLMHLGGPEFVESYLERTRPLLHLALDQKGYEIRPHTDIDQKIVTVLFYLPETNDSSVAQYGTSILKERSECEHLDPHDWNRYETLYTAPFLANSMLAFRVGKDSWHGVKPVHNPVRRRSIQYFLILDED